MHKVPANRLRPGWMWKGGDHWLQLREVVASVEDFGNASAMPHRSPLFDIGTMRIGRDGDQWEGAAGPDQSGQTIWRRTVTGKAVWPSAR